MPAYVLLVADRSQQWEIYVAAGLLGIGIGLSFSAMANLIVQNVRQDQTGVATGMNAVTRTLGGAFGGQLAATLLASNLGAAGIPTSSGFTLSFLMCLIALAGALGFALAVPRRSANDLLYEAAGRDYGVSGTAASGVATTKLKLSSRYRCTACSSWRS